MRKAWNDLNGRLGILCLTEDPNSDKMWEKYGNGEKGICVGFNSNLLFSHIRGGGGPVQYQAELPIVSPFDSFDDWRIKLIYFKLRCWDFENEYRLNKMYDNVASDEDRQITFPAEIVELVVFGRLSAESTRRDVIDVCLKNGIQARFYMVNDNLQVAPLE